MWMWRNHKLTKWVAFSIHKSAARLGVHILPKHYYSPFADLEDLRRTRDRWARPSAMAGVGMPSLDEQLCTIERLLSTAEARDWKQIYDQAVTDGIGQGFGVIEAKVLYAMLRVLRPQKVIEVGGGVSSACIAHALKANAKRASHVIIEPFPSPALRRLDSSSLLVQPVQLTNPEVFRELGDGDFLFIDSTHAVKAGSDVNYLVLEVLPRLRANVTVHFHDINLPYDYRADLFETLYQWAETSLLHAFLIGNTSVEILFSLSQLHHQAPDQLKKIVAEYRPMPTSDGLFAGPTDAHFRQELHFPTSIYFRTAREIRPTSVHDVEAKDTATQT